MEVSMRKTNSVIIKCRKQLNNAGIDYDAAYHKSKLLLKIYRDVVWSLSERSCDLQYYAYELGGQDLERGLCYLEGFAPDIKVSEFEEKVCCVMESKMLVDIIDKALIKVRDYPEKGNLYFEILTKQFIDKFNYTEKDMLEILDMERSTFYDRKKEAIYVFSICLFGYTIPEIRGEFQYFY